MIVKTKEDYLRAIYHLEEEQDNDPDVSSVDICNYLKISKSSVSEMLRKLTKRKLVNSELYGKVTLTKEGRSFAVGITRKHRIIEVFLSEVLKIKGALIHEESHRLEHAFSNESIDSIFKIIKNTKSCPHGKRIPQINVS